MTLSDRNIVNNVFPILSTSEESFSKNMHVFLVDSMNNIITRIHGFKILNVQFGSTHRNLRKDSYLLLFITLPRESLNFYGSSTYTQTLSLGGYDSLTCIRSQTRQCPLLAELPQRLLPNSEKVYGSTDSL